MKHIQTRLFIIVIALLVSMFGLTLPALAAFVSTSKEIKTGSPASFEIGGTIDFVLTITNTGPYKNTYTTVEDLPPGGAPVSLITEPLVQNPGDVWTYDFPYTVAISDIKYDSIGEVYYIENGFRVKGYDNSIPSDPIDATVYKSAVIDISPEITIKKYANDVDADSPETGPIVPVGSTVVFKYVVTNTGNIPLKDIKVTDNVLGDIGSIGSLGVGESATLTANDIAELDWNDNIGKAEGTAVVGLATVSDTDPANYFGSDPSIMLEKIGAWVDGGVIGIAEVGELIKYTFSVKNTGNVTLYEVTVTDPLVTVDGGPLASLAAGATDSTTFTGSYAITQADIDAGFVYNLALATGYDPNEEPVTDEDDHKETLPQKPSIDIEKYVNGEDADSAPGVLLNVGDAVTFKFIVTNTGNMTLHNVAITDNVYGSIGTITALAPGGTQTFTLDKFAEEGQHTNTATVTTTEGATDSDDGNYYGEAGDEGLTPGYWKNHAEDWTYWLPNDLITEMFPLVTKWYDLEEQTLMETLSRKIKQTESNAPSILLRAAVAAVLNALHPDINYPWSAERIISEVTYELNKGTYASMLVLKDTLDMFNNYGADID